MLLTRLELQGLRHGEQVQLEDLGPIVDLPAGKEGIAVLDGISLWCAGLHPDVLRAMLPRLGLELSSDDGAMIEEKAMPVQVSFADPTMVNALLAPGATKAIVVTAAVELDPPMFRTLREHAVRQPMLIAALSQNPTVQLKVGWLFNRDCSVASISVQNVLIGATEFPVHGADPWLFEVLREIGARFLRLQESPNERAAGSWLANYGLSADSGRRDRFSACAEQLKAAPFGFETLEVIADKGSFYPAFDDDMSRSRQVGIGALDALALVGSLFLEQPDILLVDSPGGAWSTGTALREWLEKTLEQDRAPCEQVFWVGDCL